MFCPYFVLKKGRVRGSGNPLWRLLCGNRWHLFSFPGSHGTVPTPLRYRFCCRREDNLPARFLGKDLALRHWRLQEFPAPAPPGGWFLRLSWREGELLAASGGCIPAKTKSAQAFRQAHF